MKQINKLLDKSGKLLQLDIRYFSKNSLFLLLREVVAGLFGFVLTFVLARQFTKYTFGEYNLVFSLLGMLSIFSLPGMMDSILNSVARGFDKSVVEGTKLRFKTSFFSLPLFIVLIYFYLHNQQPTISLLLLLSIPFFPLFYSFKTYHVFLIAKEKFTKLFWLSFINGLITSALVITVTLFFRKIYLTFLSLVIISSFLDLTFYFLTQKEIKGNKSDSTMKRFGYFLTLTNLISLLVNNLDKVVLGLFAGLSSLAVFSVANLLPHFIDRTLRSLEAVLIPKIIKQGERGNREAIKKHFPKTLFAAFLLFLLAFLISPFFVKFFFNKYQDAIFFTRLLCLPLLFTLPTTLLSKIIVYQKRLGQTLFLSYGPGLLKILAYVILIPRFGIFGLIGSLLLAQLFNFLALGYFSFKNQKKL